MDIEEFKTKIFHTGFYKKYFLPFVATYKSIPYKRVYLISKKRGTILFYPEKPNYVYVIYKVCHILGYTITNIPQRVNLIVYFQDSTYRKPDKTLHDLSKKYQVVNYHCQDISKQYVEAVHKKIFGYGLGIDPAQWKGTYVKKTDENAKHSGIILDKPEMAQEGFVYQRVVNNQKNNKVVDIRLPIFKKVIPFAYLKYRDVRTRFKNTNIFVEMIDTEKILSKEEYNKIVKFCQEIGLDYGEIDVLRDNDTKKLYIVDVNNTPAGPPNHISKIEYHLALQKLAETFQSQFFQ